MSSSRMLLLAAVASAATLAACDVVRPSASDGGGSTQCTSCHGYPPPPGVPGVGTDATHPENTNCHACHPGTVDANGDLIPASAGGLHGNGKVDASGGHADGFGSPAVHGPAAIAELTSCQACHGTDFAGGLSGKSCNACHETELAGDWTTNCTFCHGAQMASYTSTPANLLEAAPPDDVAGSSAISSIGVGAHQAHLTAGHVASPIACDACHTVPADLAHVKGQPAAVTFSSFAGATAAWDRAAAKCSNVYCHGATLDGGSAKSPVWTTADGSQRTCGSCHGAPPSTAEHANVTALSQCATCHPETVDGNGAILVSGGKHVNGVVDGVHPSGWATPSVHGYQAQKNITTCTSCHGGDYAGGVSGVSCDDCHRLALAGDWKTNCTFCHGAQLADYTPTAANLVKAAPPEGVQGQTVATDVHVGAHAKHVAGSLARAISCDVCHPAVADALGHFSGGRANVTFSGVANTGTTSSYTSTSSDGTCTTYCHGQFTGGSSATPSWTGTIATDCTACHGAPPTFDRHWTTSSHRSLACSRCHTGYDPTTKTVDPSTHVNGAKDVTYRNGTPSTPGWIYSNCH